MASPRFSFSGWNSFSLAPKVNPASVPIQTPGLLPPATAAAPQLVGQTSAANPNLPAWLQQEVDRINAQEALRTQLAGQVTGGGASAVNEGGILSGFADILRARTSHSQMVNQMNEQARLANLVAQRDQLQPTSAFSFTNPFNVNRIIGLGNQIQDFQNINLPLAAGSAPRRNASGWLSSPWA